MNFIEPTLILDKNKCIRNIEQMANKAKRNNLIFRPHVKTHQSAEIANSFKDFGVDKITASSLKQAIYFADNGWKDITVAFPANILEIERINYLASKIKLNLLVESLSVINFLKENLKSSANIFIKIDVGYNRTGIKPENTKLIDSIIAVIQSSNLLTFEGFLCHAGQSYDAKSLADIERIHNESKEIIKNLKQIYSLQFPNLIASVGDTPTCVKMNNFDYIDEIRPGTFVFNDLAQWKIGACKLDEIAIAMVCPIVALHPERNEVVIYGGGVHFSRDFSFLPSGEKYYGFVVEQNVKSWNVNNREGILKSVSQEHGVVKFNSSIPPNIKEGNLLTILPIHSCLTGNLMKEYVTLENEVINRF